MAADTAAAKRAFLLQQLRHGNAPIPAAPLLVPEAGARVPLTRGQEHVWLDSQLSPDESVYNEAVMIRRTGPCDVDPLRRAFNLALSRHDAWRTTFVSDDGRLHQVIRSHVDQPLPLIDLSSLPEHEREARAMAMAAEDARAPFDLEHDLLVRPLLVRVSEVDHRLCLTLHHLIFDGVALRLLLSEMVQAYDSLAAGHPVELADPPAPYAHYACWERRHVTSELLEPRLAFWRDRLRGATPVALPADRPPPADRTRRGAMARTFVERPTIDRLKEVAQQESATFFLVLLTAYSVLLHRYSGQDDLVIAALVDGRRHRALEKLMGFMVNPLPVRVDVTGDPSFAELLGRVRESFLIGLANEVPFGDLLRELHPGRAPSQSPIFQAMFSLDPPLPPLGDGWELDEIDVEFTAAKCDVQLLQDDRDAGMVGRFVYSTDLFESDTWKRLAEGWGVLLEGIATDPSCRVSALPFMTDAERTTLLHEWNRTEAPYPATSCVHELFEEQARIQPEAPAVVHDDRQLTYGQLDAAADELAGRLRCLGVGPDARVGLFAERSTEMVVAVLGILKAGGAYVPLDPAHPAERLGFIVEDAGIRVVVTQTHLRSRLPETDASIICVDQPDRSVGVTGARAGPDDLAYVIYTSGSTGSPKGVMIEHRGVVNHVAALIRDYGLGPADTVLQLPPLSVHPSVRDILGTLSAGARLVLLDEAEAKDPLQIVEIIARTGVTCALSFVPSLLRAVLDDPRTNQLPDAKLRLILTCGEQLRVRDAQRASKRFGCVVANQFGPTETIMACSKHTDDGGGPPGAMVPAGRAEANARLYVVSSHGDLAPIGAVGELLVGGVSLARGYLNRPELTAQRFGADPFSTAPGARVHRTGDLVRYRTDGCLEFLGRVDDQVKIRGYRVELGEVEAELALCPGVDRAAVAVQTDDQGNRRLLGVVTSDGSGPSLDTKAARSWLERRLPAYMVPAAILVVEQIPLQPSGKVDRAALSALEARPEPDLEYVPPSAPLEHLLAELWAEVLDLERVGVDDNFFALGGDSLLGAALFAKMAQRMDASVPLGLLFRAPTIRELAKALDGDDEDEQTSLVLLRAGGSKSPLFLAHGVSGLLFRYVDLVRRLDPEQPVYGLQPTTQFVDNPRRLRIEDLAGRYVEDIVRMQPDGPYRLAGFCFGGIVVLEVAHQLEQLGHTVATLALFDAEPPTSPRASRARREAAQLASLVRRHESATAYVQRRLANARVKARRWPWLADYWLHIRSGRPLPNRWDDVERVQSRQASPLWRSLSRALGSYVAPTTNCRVTYFRAGEPTGDRTQVRFLPGDDRAGGSYVIDGPGLSHETLMQEPHVGALATALMELLDSPTAG